jgi:hypothetical protein
VKSHRPSFFQPQGIIIDSGLSCEAGAAGSLYRINAFRPGIVVFPRKEHMAMPADYNTLPLHPHSTVIFDGLVSLVWDRELPAGYENEMAFQALAKLLLTRKKAYSFYCLTKVMHDPIGNMLRAMIREALAEDIFWAFDPNRAGSVPAGQFYACYRSLIKGDAPTEKLSQCAAARLAIIINHYHSPDETWWLCKAVKIVAARSFYLS